MASLRGSRLWTIYVDKAAGTARSVASYVNTFGRLRDVAPGATPGTLWMMTTNGAGGDPARRATTASCRCRSCRLGTRHGHRRLRRLPARQRGEDRRQPAADGLRRVDRVAEADHHGRAARRGRLRVHRHPGGHLPHRRHRHRRGRQSAAHRHAVRARDERAERPSARSASEAPSSTATSPATASTTCSRSRPGASSSATTASWQAASRRRAPSQPTGRRRPRPRRSATSTTMASPTP